MSEKNKVAPLINRVANSGIIVFNLEDHFPKKEIVALDLKPFLFKELILKEKDFRTALKELDWSVYEGKIVTIYNSNDAIIPVWAYMLVSSYLSGLAEEIYIGNQEAYLTDYYQRTLSGLSLEQYAEKRVVVKGCSNKPVPASAYAMMVDKLKPYAQSIMYGEPCSTVPIFKRPRKLS